MWIEIHYQKLFSLSVFYIFLVFLQKPLLTMLTDLISVSVCLSETVIHIKILHDKYYSIYVVILRDREVINSLDYDIIVIICNNSPDICIVLSDKTY